MKISKKILTSGLCLASALAASAQSVSVSFSGATDYANNFRVVNTSTGNTLAQTGEFLTATGNASNTPAVIAVYDTTPLSNVEQNAFTLTEGQSISVSLDFANISSNGAASSIGFYFINPTAETSAVNYLALININNSGANEAFRFSRTAALTASGANGTLANGSPATADTGYTVSDSTFRTVTATYTYLSASSVSMSLVAGLTTSTISYTGVTPLSSVAIGFRVNPTAGVPPLRTLQLDNFNIVAPTAIPEPASYAALAGFAMLGFVASRRTRR